MKPPLRGLVTIGGLPDRLDDTVGGTSLSVDWADLQPEPGGDLVRPNAVDEAVEAVRAAGAARGCPRGVKLRVLAGVHSPDWAKTLDGAPVPVTLPQDGLSGDVPRFWTPRFAQAYADLQQRLADAYDDVPEVREVAMTRCTTFYGEPLLRQAGVPANVRALTAAGLSEDVDRACLAEQSAAHGVWERTPSSLALNPYLSPESPEGGPVGTPDMALDAAATCRDELGERCVLANNSLRWPVPEGAYAQLYAGMREMGGPLEFQTAGPRRVGDLVAAVRFAVEAGASSVETEQASALQAGPELLALAESTGWGPGR